MSTHAVLSPSGAHRWMTCPGSVVLEAGRPDNGNAYSEEGTAAHAVAAMVLTEGRPASAYVGRRIEVGPHRTVECTADMAAAVQHYVDSVQHFASDGTLLVEQSVPIGHITGEEGAKGTADAIVVLGQELQLHDLKYGRGVRVSAENNPQLMLYALGALEVVAPLGIEITRVRLVIHQPRLEAVSEWDCNIEVLEVFADEAMGAAWECRDAMNASMSAKIPIGRLNPSDDACKFCKAKADCPALAKKVQDEVGASFEDISSDPSATETGDYNDDTLSVKMQAVDLIEDWCKAVRAEVERRLLAGTPVPGYKLVQGRAGARSWTNATEAEDMIRKVFRLPIEDAYEMKIISPTTAEKLAKEGKIGPKQWPKLQPLISRSEGKPSVAPESDKRPAIEVKPVIDSFEVLA